MDERESITQEELSEDLEELFANTIEAERDASCTYKYDLMYEIKTRYRFARRQISALLREKIHNNFKQILYVTNEEIPYDYISAFRQQYPNKELKVVIPIIGEQKRLIKTPIKFKYYLQNKINHARIYKLPLTKDNITVYGIYSEAFSNIASTNLFKDIKYLSQYLKCVRIFGKIIKPDIIHSDIAPFYLGAEFESKQKYPVKVLQTISDFSMRELKFEPFWAVLNMADKSGMKKLCKDKIIKKCIALLFKQRETNNLKQMKECMEFIYQNYIAFRSTIDKSENFAENTLFERLNERTLKLFPQITIPESKVYNPFFNGIKRADYWAVLSKSYYKELFEQIGVDTEFAKIIETTRLKSGFVHKAFIPKNEKIHHSFSLENFRDRRYKNKEYLLHEFSKERINMDFIDKNFFKGEHKIYGYLDSFYDAPLFFGKFSTNILDDGFDIAVSAVLKLFELNKNIQVIFNIPQGMENNYVKSFVEFCEKSPAINGRWIFIDGEINLPQFYSASDMILIPSRINVDGRFLQEAMNLGCIPITTRSGIFNDIVVDIFDNMLGCGFKTEVGLNIADDPELIYFKTVSKALNFYLQNGSWNLIIKNCLNNETGWDFEALEQYNQIYESLI